MSTLQQCIDLYHARQAARMPTPTGEAAAVTIADSGPSGDEPAACAQTTAAALPVSAFGALLRRYRMETPSRYPHAKRAYLSQEALADAIGVHPSYISILETGRQRPSLYLLAELSNALRLPTREHVRLVQAAGYTACVRRVS